MSATQTITTPRLSTTALILRSLRHRRARSLSALLALTVSALLATALLTLYTDLDAKLHREFRAFGANLTVTSASGAFLTPDQIAKARDLAGPDAEIAPFAYAVATNDRGTPVVIAGVDFATLQKMDKWWGLDHWPGPGDIRAAVLGKRAAGFLADEHTVLLTFNGKTETFTGMGRVSTGSDLDDRIFLPQPVFEAFTGVHPTVLEIEIPGGGDRVQSALDHLRPALPGLAVEPIRQAVAGESRIVDRTHALMGGAVLLIALTVAISVLATLSASVLERRRDFALMKALGAPQGHLLRQFLLEAAVLAIAGALVGYIVGSGIAFGIGELNFGTAILPRLTLLPAVLGLNLLIAAFAAALPSRLLRGLEPAALLKGE